MLNSGDVGFRLTLLLPTTLPGLANNPLRLFGPSRCVDSATGLLSVRLRLTPLRSLNDVYLLRLLLILELQFPSSRGDRRVLFAVHLDPSQRLGIANFTTELTQLSRLFPHKFQHIPLEHTSTQRRTQFDVTFSREFRLNGPFHLTS